MRMYSRAMFAVVVASGAAFAQSAPPQQQPSQQQQPQQPQPPQLPQQPAMPQAPQMPQQPGYPQPGYPQQSGLPGQPAAAPMMPSGMGTSASATPSDQPAQKKEPGRGDFDAGGQVRLPNGPDANGKFATFNWVRSIFARATSCSTRSPRTRTFRSRSSTPTTSMAAWCRRA